MGFAWQDNVFQTSQQRLIELRVAAARLVPSRQVFQLDTQDRALQTIHAAVPADKGVMIFLWLPVIAQQLDFRRQLRVVGDDGAGLTVGAQIFAGIKTETPGLTN
ncbi:MAG: hypothetical protein ALAOOOJD_01104 [bacterium]|nr:hypothetical protein [bacterium]